MQCDCSAGGCCRHGLDSRGHPRGHVNTHTPVEHLGCVNDLLLKKGKKR